MLELLSEIDGIDKINVEEIREKIKEYLNNESIRTALEQMEKNENLDGESMLPAEEAGTEEGVIWPEPGGKWPAIDLRELLEQAKAAASAL